MRPRAKNTATVEHYLLSTVAAFRSSAKALRLCALATLGVSCSTDHRQSPNVAPTHSSTVQSPPDAALDAYADAASPYRYDEASPPDKVPLGLLKHLAKEADLIALCNFDSFSDLYDSPKDIYHLFNVNCTNAEVWRGPTQSQSLRFLWHVEKGGRLPRPGSQLLVLLAKRRDLLDPPQDVPWAALDIGVFRFSPRALAKLKPQLIKS